jgi:hypothetical protein
MTLRTLLGTRHRNHLAIEDYDPAATPATPATEDTLVVMKGPLADVYSEALAKVYDKDAPIEDPQAGDPAAQPNPPEETGATVDTSNLQPAEGQTQETVEAAIVSEVGNIVLESQAIDAAVASSIANAIADETPANNDGYETLYAIDETQVTPTETKNVTELLAEADKPENITVLIDDVVPDAVLDPTAPTVTDTKDLSAALESMVLAMGGKVVHSFGDYVKARAARQAK